MMEIKSEGAQSYTIPLDSVDLTYLSKYVRTPHAGKRPLWTRKCLDGESEYCHVQIVTQDDNEDCYSEETFDTFNCHVCNIEVPVLCFKKHNESEKHVTLKEIFRKVIERVSKQINISVINNDKDIEKDVYYCVPCSKIIKIENKLRHESSQHHEKSQRGISVVHEFYKIFEENEGCVVVKDVNNEKILYQKRFGTEIIQNNTKNNNVKKLTNEDKSNNDETKTVRSINDHTMKSTSTVEHLVKNEKHNEEFTSEENYLKHMVKKYNLKANLPLVDGEFIHVASPSGVRAKISRDHFHSYKSIVEGIRVYCQMCDESVELREESMHKVSEEHARKIFLPVNEQIARTRNVYSSHCLICNTLVMTSSLSKHHLNNDNHVKLLNSAKLTDICQNNEDLANSINTKNNIERTHTEEHKIENHVNKTEKNKILEFINKEYICKLNLSENCLGDHHNESVHLKRTKDATPVQKLAVCELFNVSVAQNQMEHHNPGTSRCANAFKKKCTGVADGLQTYFSLDDLKTDRESSEIKNDARRNDNAAKQKYTPKNDNVTNKNDTLKNDVDEQNYSPGNYNVTIQNALLKNDNVAKQNDSSENDNVTNPNDILKNDNVAKQNDSSENDNVAKQNNSSENDNVTNPNDILKNDNVAKQNDSSENDNVTNQNDSLKNDNVAKQNDVPKNNNITNQNDTQKNDNVAKQNDSFENDNVTNPNDILKNDNVAKQNDLSENDNVTNQNALLKSDNLAKQNDSSENDNVAKQDDSPENHNITNQNDIHKNDNVAKKNYVSENDNVTNQNDTFKNGKVTNVIDTLKNGNVTNQNDTLKNDNETNQNSTLKNDKVTNHNDTLKNDNAFVQMTHLQKTKIKGVLDSNALVQMCVDTLENHDEYYFFDNT